MRASAIQNMTLGGVSKVWSAPAAWSGLPAMQRINPG